MERKVAVKIENVSKSFKIPHESHNSMKGAILNFFKKKTYTTHQALKGIDCEVYEGEFFGIVGKNGSGKSTLLKIIANIYTPDTGKVVIDGRLSPFIEVGVGFNLELTARENVFLNGAILGMTKKEIASNLQKIIEFSELEEFMDMKLKNFSSGMLVRLAFSVAIQAHADVLLIDEVLAVGDAKFQEKCFKTFRELKAQGKTIILVTHDMGSVKQFCDRALLIDKAEMVSLGSVERAVQIYNEINGLTDAVAENAEATDDRWGSFKAKFTEVKIHDGEGKAKGVFKTGDNLGISLKYTVNSEVPNPNVDVAVFRDDGVYCFDINTDLDKVSPKKITKDGSINLIYNNLPLQKGIYYFKIGMYEDYDKEVIDFLDKGPSFKVLGDNQFGLVNIEHKWEL